MEKHRWVALADGLPDEAVRIVNKAIEIVDRLNFVVGMIAQKNELKTVEENLEVLRLSVSIESLVNMVIALTKLHGGKKQEVDQLVTEFKNLVEEVQESQKSGSFASTPKGTAEYIINIVNILERVYNILYTSKAMWLKDIGVDRLPRKKIRDDVANCLMTYYDSLLPAAEELDKALSLDAPKVDPEYMLRKFAVYILLIPRKYIPKSALVQVSSNILMDRKYAILRKLLGRYNTKDFEKYTYEAPMTSEPAYIISNAVETTRAEFMLYWQYSIEAYLDALDTDLIFEKLSKYTPEEIDLAIAAMREQKNIDRFWDIFVNVALKSVGVHVEMGLEEEQKGGKKKSKKKSEPLLDVEIPPDVEQELEEVFGGGF